MITSDVTVAAAAVDAGQIVGLPTDTVYGLGVNPLDGQAVAALFEAKGRPENKPVGLLVSDFGQAAEVGDLSGKAGELAKRHWPGGLTLIVTPKTILADWVGDAQTRTVGIRVPDHPVAVSLLRLTGPLAVTSANISGGPEALSEVAAEAIFGDGVAVYLKGKALGGEASTVIDVTAPKWRVLRRGPVRV